MGGSARTQKTRFSEHPNFPLSRSHVILITGRMRKHSMVWAGLSPAKQREVRNSCTQKDANWLAQIKATSVADTMCSAGS